MTRKKRAGKASPSATNQRPFARLDDKLGVIAQSLYLYGLEEPPKDLAHRFQFRQDWDLQAAGGHHTRYIGLTRLWFKLEGMGLYATLEGGGGRRVDSVVEDATNEKYGQIVIRRVRIFVPYNGDFTEFYSVTWVYTPFEVDAKIKLEKDRYLTRPLMGWPPEEVILERVLDPKETQAALEAAKIWYRFCDAFTQDV